MKRYLASLLVFFAFCGNAIAAQSYKWEALKSTHFIVYYQNAPKEFIEKLVEKAEIYYNEIATDLGFSRYNFWLWDNRAKIYIYDNAADYASATLQPGWSSGSTLMAAKIIHAYPDARNFLTETLAHEMGHIIFREFVGFDNSAVPLWLDEAVASYQQKSRSAFTNALLKEAIKKGNLIKLQDLSGFNLLKSADVTLVQLFYSEAFSIVHFLVKEFGKDKFVLFCQNLRDKKDLERALASVYPFSNLKELGSAWERYLVK